MRCQLWLLALLTIPGVELSAQVTPKPDSRRSRTSEVGKAKYRARSGGRNRLGSNRRRGAARAIRLALTWLAKHQDKDGGWSADTFMDNETLRLGRSRRTDGAGGDIGRIGVTALCLLSFLGDGQTLDNGDHKKSVKKGVLWLKSKQQGSGALINRNQPGGLLEHAMATQALCEACGLSAYRALQPSSLRALAYLLSQQNEDGGWSHVGKGKSSDAFTTCHAVMAYCAGKDFALEVDHNDNVLGRARRWLDGVTRDDGTVSAVGNIPIAAGSRDEETAMAAALLTRFFLNLIPQGTTSNSARKTVVDKAGEALLAYLPKGLDFERTQVFWYATSHAMFQVGGRSWQRWEQALNPVVVKTQRMDGHFVGSWDPGSEGAQAGGRLYATVLALLTLQAHYRYTKLPR